MISVRSLVALALVSLLTCSVLSSCDDESGVWYTFFHMEIDSLSAPAEVMQTDTLRITFYSVPMDCCYSFHRYLVTNVDFMDNTLRIRIIGKQAHNIPCVCEWPGRVNEMEYEVTSMLVGYYYIEVEQPDDSVLRDSVLVNR